VVTAIPVSLTSNFKQDFDFGIMGSFQERNLRGWKETAALTLQSDSYLTYYFGGFWT
jgi:hypothetical protein